MFELVAHQYMNVDSLVHLSLRVAGHLFLYEVHKAKPLLLLDDVFSELDTERTERLLHLLVADQTFITTAIEPKYIDANTYYEIQNGKVVTA